MVLPARLSAGVHVLYVSESSLQRVSLIEALVTDAIRTGKRLVLVAEAELVRIVEASAAIARIRPRQMTLTTLDDLVGDGDEWSAIAAAIGAFVDDAERRASGWRLDDPESGTLIYVDLDGVFARCNAASEMMSIIYAVREAQAKQRRCVVEAISIDTIPPSMPTEFFSVHTDWIVDLPTVPTINDGALLDRAAHRVALETPEFRNQFLATARTKPEDAMRLVPSLFADYRRGMLIVDHHLQIRHCSPRAAELLRRDPADLIERPLNTAVDGVDLVTIRRECAHAVGGAHSPFVVSWRLAPGHYEPREVTIDAITSEHRPVGYAISVALVESTRGPRAVYRQLVDEEAPAEGSLPGSPEDDDALASDDVLSDSLQGTQITRREHEVLLLILAKQANRDIARQLNIAEVTVKKHLTSIYRKLRITNRSELVRSFEAPRVDATRGPGGSE